MSQIVLPYEYDPRQYQLDVWRYMEGNRIGKRAACEWHRRAGKDLFAINLIATKSQERVGTYWHMLPTYKQGRNIVWNGFTKEGRTFLSHLPSELIANKNSTEMRATFTNGSIYQVVGTDNVNLLVGTNPVGVVFSEYSLHDPAAWDYIRPILAENDGWALFIYTLRGKNHGWQMGQMAKKNKAWFYQRLIAGDNGTKREDGTPVISDAVIQAERAAGMPEELIQQEFYCSADAPLVGAYYSTQMRWLDMQKGVTLDAETGELISDRFRDIPWDPRLNVSTAWDIGYDDSTSIWFYQETGNEVRIIDYYENSGESLAHYIKYCKQKPYVYGQNLAPHDIEVHEFSTGKTRIEAARELGWKFRTVPKHGIEDGIESVRSFLPRCWFNMGSKGDDVANNGVVLGGVQRGVAALREYCKEWDDEKRVFRSQPLHNWASHGADAFRTLAWGHRKANKKKFKTTQSDDYDYLRGKPRE